MPCGRRTRRRRSPSNIGSVASHYERYRPGPPLAAVDWILSSVHAKKIIDLGAGTGALTRLLVDRAEEVVAIEPDDRMRSVLAQQVPSARALAGRGESMPVPDSYADAVIASSSGHWMDPVPTLLEVGRVLVPGGVLGVLWAGPDPEGPFLAQAQAMFGAKSESGDAAGGADDQKADDVESEFGRIVMGEASRPDPVLVIPLGVPFDQPEHEIFRWDVALNADELIGLLGTFSWIITLDDATRDRLVAEARRLLRDVLGLVGDKTVDVAYRSEAWRSRRHR